MSTWQREEISLELTLNNNKPDTLLNITIPAKCVECECPNFKIWGTIIQDKISVETRCVKCGNKINSIKHDLKLS